MHVRKISAFRYQGYDVLLINGYNLFRRELSRPLDRFVWGVGFCPLQSTVHNRVAEYGCPIHYQSVCASEYARDGLIWR